MLRDEKKGIFVYIMKGAINETHHGFLHTFRPFERMHRSRTRAGSTTAKPKHSSEPSADPKHERICAEVGSGVLSGFDKK